jgi:hypothetical protein
MISKGKIIMRSKLCSSVCLAVFSLLLPSQAFANNFQESQSWQFNTQAEKVNQAAIQDLIRKKKSGFYAPPVYVTNIDRQFNCNVSASAFGNNGSNSTVSHSPNQSGANSNATGNASNTSAGGYGNLPSSGGVSSNQSNSGDVDSNVRGDTDMTVRGDTSQVLNSNQTNSGSQSSNVAGSNACTFGTLN